MIYNIRNLKSLKWQYILALICLMFPIVSSGGPGFEVRHLTVQTGESVVQSSRNLVIAGKADVVVAGGGISGVMAALTAAGEGKSVILLESRNYLGQELTSTYNCTQGIRIQDVSFFPEMLRHELTESKVIQESRFSPEALRSFLLKRVNSEPNIEVYLFSRVNGVVMEGNAIRGVVFSGRDGRQVILAGSVVDATEDAVVSRSAGARVDMSPLKSNTARRFISVGGTRYLSPGSRPVPSSLQIGGDSVVVHDGFIELAVPVSFGDDLAEGISAAHAGTLDKSYKLLDYLKEEGVVIQTAVPGPETWFDKVPAVQCSGNFDRDKDIDYHVNSGILNSREIAGLIVAGRISGVAPQIKSIAELFVSGEIAGRTAAKNAVNARKLELSDVQQGLDANKEARIQIKELLGGIEKNSEYQKLEQSETHIPVAGNYDVIVAGGGTSGVFAAISAARMGADVIMIEILPNLGGISSNRVTGYYWGVPWKSFLRHEVGERIQLGKSGGVGPLEKVRFSGEDKKFVLQDIALKAGVKILYMSLVSGTVVEGNKVRGVVVDNASGRQALLSKVVIDATGHGGVAVAGGAEYEIGRESDGFMNEIEHGPMRDPTNLRDISSSYLKYPSYAVSMNIRESRRIAGDYTVTFDDVLQERVFPDVICRWRSNYDTHLPTSANMSDKAQDWVGILGMWRKPLIGSIPFGSILPRGMDNIMVAAMAYSTDHDALIGGRMQPDLEHLGEAAGIIAAMACKRNCTPREVPIANIQEELIKAGILRAKDVPHIKVQDAPSLDALHRQDYWRAEREKVFLPELEGVRMELTEAVNKLGSGNVTDAMAGIYLEGGKAASLLRPILKSGNPSAREEAAVLLGMLGDKSSIPVLMDILRNRNTRRFEYTLDQASSRPSVPLYWISVILLGRMEVKESVPMMVEILNQPPPPDKLREMQRNAYGDDMFESVHSCPPPLVSFILAALGRIGDPSAIPAVKPYLQVSSEVEISRENRDFEIAWGIRTNAARALLNMGDASALPVLNELMGADQSLLRDYTYKLRKEITGQK